MRLGFRSRILLLGAGMGLLLALIGGALTEDAVRGNFERYSRHEASDQAWDLALYLEAWINHAGHQEDPAAALAQFFAGEVEGFSPYAPDDPIGPQWGDWGVTTAELLGLTPAALGLALQEQSLDELCESLDRDPFEVSTRLLAKERALLMAEYPGIEHAEAVDLLAEIAAEVYAFLFLGPEEVDGEGAEEALPERLAWFLDTLIDDARILVLDPDGRILFDLDGGPLGGVVSETLYEDAAPIHDWSSGALLCEIAVAAGPGHYRATADSFLRGVRGSLWKIAGLLLLAAALFTLWFGRRVLSPIQALTAATGRLAQGQTEGRLPIHSKDELGELSASFNAMLDTLEQQRALRERMVADLAHELHTPLSVIQLELAGLEAGMQTPEECSRRIGVELAMLKRLSSDVALLAEMDRGTLALDCRPTSPTDCCHEAVERWHGKAASKGIDLHYAGSEELPMMHADGIRVVQVLGNLIGNALRHTPEGGAVRIQASHGVDAGGQAAIEISVSDTGEGIPPEQLAVIFERFVRGDAARTRDQAGRGLGLAIVADLVARHGGKVWAESTPGQGSTFRFTIPTRSSQEAST